MMLFWYFLQQRSKVGYGAQIMYFERKGAQCYYSKVLWKDAVDAVTEMLTNKKEKKNPSSYCRECVGQKYPYFGRYLENFFDNCFEIVFEIS